MIPVVVNINIYFASMRTLSQKQEALQDIDNTFMESGHTHLECDTDHDKILKSYEF